MVRKQLPPKADTPKPGIPKENPNVVKAERTRQNNQIVEDGKKTNKTSLPKQVNPFNLAGTNNIKNSIGTPNVNHKPATGSPKKQETVKSDFTSASTNTNTKKRDTYLVQKDLEKNQTTLSGMADESNRRAQKALGDAISDVKTKAKESYDYWNGVQNKITEPFTEFREQQKEKNLRVYDNKLAEYNNNTTQEDYAKMFDEQGNDIDYSQDIKNLEYQISVNENIINTSNNENQKAVAQQAIDSLREEVDSYKLLEKKRTALKESYALSEAQKAGDVELYNSLREQFSHGEDTLLDRFGSAGAHLLTETKNLIPTALDQLKFRGQVNNAMEHIEQLEMAHANGEIDDEVFNEAMQYWNDGIDQYQNEYNDSTSQIIKKVADQYSANTYYGANQIETFALQAGESTAQFLLHFAIAQGIGTVMNMGATAEAIREGAGDLATITMSMASSTSRFNELMAEGVYDIQTCGLNADMYGLVSSIVEKVGMDRFVSMLGTDVSKYAFTYVLKQIGRSGVSEGLEEVVEGLIDPLVDSLTLGTDYEVNGSELMMEFLLGGVSGLVTTAGALGTNMAKTSIVVNKLINQNEQFRQNVKNERGKLVVTTKRQYNALQNEVNSLKDNLKSMTSEQANVATELIQKGEEALRSFEQDSVAMGINLASDIVLPVTSEEADTTIYKAEEPDFNEEVQTQKTFDELKNRVNANIDQLAINKENFNRATQEILDKNGYNIKAEVFNNLDEKRQNDAMVALDASKAFNIDVEVTDADGIRDYFLSRGFNGTPQELEELVEGVSGFVDEDGRILIDGNKNPILSTLSHEFTHGTESSRLYEPLRELVKTKYGNDWENIVQEKINEYADIQELTWDNAEKEVVARYVEDMLGDEEFINDLIRYNYSLASQIYQDLKAVRDTDEIVQIRNAFEKAFADSMQEEMDNEGELKLSFDMKKFLSAVAPKAVQGNGSVMNILSQIKNLRNDPDGTVSVMMPTKGALAFVGIPDLVFMDKYDLNHVDRQSHNLDDTLLADLIQHVKDYAVLGLDYRTRNGTTKNVILDKDGTYYVMSLYKNNYLYNGYSLDSIKTLYEYNKIRQADPSEITEFIDNNLSRPNPNGAKNRYYVNEKSNDFLMRTNLRSRGSVLNSIATDLRVNQNNKNVKKFSYNSGNNNQIDTHLTNENDSDILSEEDGHEQFRRLQEESQRILDESGWGSERQVHYLADEAVRGRFSNILKGELESRGYGNGHDNGLLDLGTDSNFKVYKDVDGETFHDIFNTVRNALPFGELVDVHPIETTEHDGWTETGYNETHNYLSDDGMAGFSITKDGDLISVFNASGKKGFLRSVAPFIRQNAKTLDCYVLDPSISGTNLQEMYNKAFGFETTRTEDYNWDYDHDGIGKRYSEPKIAYMENPNYGMTLQYSKFDPAKNKDMRDNLGNKINKNMANRITGTRLTDSQGRPLLLCHTSSSLFSEFDPRGTDYYHYGDKIVNFYSTDPEVSGSYAYDPMQIRSAEDYAKHEKAETESKRLRKELADTEEQYDARIYELQEQLFDYSRTKEFRSVISNAISSLEGYKFDSQLEDGVRQFQIAFLEDLKNVDYPALWYERFNSLRNLAESNARYDYSIDGYGDIFQSIIDSDEFKKMSEIYDQIQLTAEDKANSLAPIKGELRDYERLSDSGKQYVGYGKALNPYILKNNSPNVNWSYLNDGDFDIDFEDYLSLQTELWNIFPKASEAELDEMMKSKNRINRFILSNVDDDIRALLIENPIILANITNMAKDSYYVDGYGSLWYDDEYEPTSMEQFVNNLDTKFAEAYDRADNSHLFTNSVTTNDVVTATLAVNDYTDNPYDGVVFENITDSASGEADDIVSDIVAMFESNQFKLMDNQNPTDNPDIRYSKKRRTDTQRSVSNEDEGVSNRYYDYGMNPARNVDIPRETEAGPTRRHANNMANSEWVSDEEAQRIVEAVESGDYAYAPVHFAEIDEQAKDTLRRIGKAKAMQEVTTDTENVTLEKAALARQLLAQMREDGQEGTPEYERLQRINSSFFTPSAQILAYGRWLRQSTPEGQIITIESEIARMQSELEQRWGDRAPDLVIPEELRREYIETKDEARRQAIREEIAQMIADKIPPTILEQLNSFRHLAMLFNPKTWTKNRLSNAIFGGIDELTRAIRSGLETVAKNYGDKHESSIFHGMELQAGAYNRFNEQERKLKKQFEQDYMDNFKQNISKYSNMDIGAFLSTSEFGEMVRDRRKSFSWELLNQLEKINKGEGKGWLKHLGLSDVPAMKNAYSKAMVGYFKKNNLDLNTVTDEQMKKARDFAFAEALYATFNTNNWLATQITDFERKADKKGRDVGAITRMAVESFIPFKRTPLNIIRTGYNYTTLGMATNLARDLYLVKHGKMNANQMINHLAQGLTGTGLVALGMLLSHLGIFRTKDDDKDRKQYFDEDNGEQDYSLNFDGFSYTIDWLDPMVVPMAMGAEIAQAIDENGLSWDNALGIASSVADPIFETSMLSGISKNLQSYQKGTKEWYGEIAKNIARNYVSQYVPSAFGALARTIDDTRRNTYADPNNKNPFNSKFAKQIKNKLPGLSMTNEPYINKQGQVEKNEDLGIGIAGRAFLNFVSPGYYSTKDIDKYDEELYRLYDSTGDLNAFPSQASKDVTFDKETMKFTDKEYTEWQKTRWQTEAKYVNEFIDSDAYKNLSDDERMKTIEDIRSYAQKVAKKEFLEGRGKEYNNDKQLNNATSALESGIELYDYYDYLNNAGTKQADKIKYLEDMDLTQEQREQLYDLSGYKTSYQDAYNKSMKDKDKSTNKKSSSKKKSSGGSKKASGGSKKASGSKSKSGGGSKPSGTLKMGKSFKLANPTNLKLDTQKVNTNKYLSSYYNTMRGSKNVSSGSSGTVVCPRCGNRVSASSGRCPVCGARL